LIDEYKGVYCRCSYIQPWYEPPVEGEPFWRTAVGKVVPGKILVRGFRLTELLEKYTYGGIAWVLWRGELPTPGQERMMNLLLSVGCEHGVNAPSTAAARFVASGGVQLHTAVAAGILALGDYHGGATEVTARVLQEGVAEMERRGLTLREEARSIIERHRAEGKRLMGYGHPIHDPDPRALLIVDMARRLGVAGRHIELALQVEGLTKEYYGRRLTLNVSGGIGAAMSDLGFDWRMGKAFFVVGRALGLVAHSYEQMYGEKPLKVPPLHQVVYEGPGERDLVYPPAGMGDQGSMKSVRGSLKRGSRRAEGRLSHSFSS
jgi:citryl-CoA lyase